MLQEHIHMFRVEHVNIFSIKDLFYFFLFYDSTCGYFEYWEESTVLFNFEGQRVPAFRN